MAVLKCKMCGAGIGNILAGTISECEYCGSMQVVPNVDDEKKIRMFNRANMLRMCCEFDKAAGIYETVISEFPDEADAYWGLCLCNYGIEYVKDPVTQECKPTCHRATFEGIKNDRNFLLALENADPSARVVYGEQADEIQNVLEKVLSICRKEDPYDVFICYKETDNNTGQRTYDSVMAQDIYDRLTEKGLKVFFSRITLEDKLGVMYEPYIFAALNSAKVMLCVGTSSENFNSVWVRNEWSRFMKLLSKDRDKVIIPCYKDMDAYELPEEFRMLQAQDMGKIGAVQDLIRGVLKLIPKEEKSAPSVAQPQNYVPFSVGTSSADNIVRLGLFDLDAGNEESAKTQFRQALNADINCFSAYVGFCLLSSLSVQERSPYAVKIIEMSPEISDIEKGMLTVERAREYLKVFLYALNKERVKYILDNHKESADSVVTENDSVYSSIGYACCILKNSEAIKLLKECGVSFNHFSRKIKNTPIPLISDVIFCNNPYMVDYLLKNGADANSYRISPAGSKMPVLCDVICRVKNYDIFKVFMKFDVDVNTIMHFKDKDGKDYTETYLYQAAMGAKDVRIVHDLLKKGADPNIRREYSGYDVPILSDVVRRAKDRAMALVLINAGADVNGCEIITSNEKTEKLPILYGATADMKDPEMVKMLFKHGADPNSCYTLFSGYSLPVMFYTLTNDCDAKMIGCFLEAGADPNCRAKIPWEKNREVTATPLYLATIKNQTDTIACLLKYKANPNILSIDQYGFERSVLFEPIAAFKNCKLVEMLLRYGADVNRVEKGKDVKGVEFKLTPLSLAIRFSGNPAMVKLISDYGADWNAEISYGFETGPIKRFKFNSLTYGVGNDMLNYIRTEGWKPGFRLI